jgi:hypothetical protein
VADGFYREHTLLAVAGGWLLPGRTWQELAVNIYYVAAIWLGMALLASVVSIRIAVPAALVEIVVGALAGNIPGIQQHVTQTDVVTFLASAGSLVLTFLAGAEIDPVSLRGHWKASLSIGLVSFLLPFLAAFGFCALVLGSQTRTRATVDHTGRGAAATLPGFRRGRPSPPASSQPSAQNAQLRRAAASFPQGSEIRA